MTTKTKNVKSMTEVWSWAPPGARRQDGLTDRQSQRDFDLTSLDFDFGFQDLTTKFFWVLTYVDIRGHVLAPSSAYRSENSNLINII
jgi:hypothetical protein